MTTPQTTPELPTLPQSLLDTIGNYGLARTDKVSPIELTHRWELLIAGIKDYAASVLAARVTAAPLEGMSESPETKQHCPLTPMQLAGAHLLLKNPGDELAQTMFTGTASSLVRYPPAPLAPPGAAEGAGIGAAPESPQPLAPPPGYAVVPLEPTREMKAAGAHLLPMMSIPDREADSVYRAMVAAAPLPGRGMVPKDGEHIVKGLEARGIHCWGPRAEDFQAGIQHAESHHGIKEGS